MYMYICIRNTDNILSGGAGRSAQHSQLPGRGPAAASSTAAWYFACISHVLVMKHQSCTIPKAWLVRRHKFQSTSSWD